MNINRVLNLLSKSPPAAQCADLLREHGTNLISLLTTAQASKDQVDSILACLQCISFSSQYPECCTLLSQQQNFPNLVRNCVNNCIKMQNSKLFAFYSAILSNLSTIEEISSKISDILTTEEMTKAFVFFPKPKSESALFFLENMARFTSKCDNVELLRTVILALKARDKCSECAARIVRNLLLVFREEQIQMQQRNYKGIGEKSEPECVQYLDIIKDICLELTGEEIQDTFDSELKEAEASQKENIVRGKKMHQKQTLLNIVESLLAYVGFDRHTIKTYYPQLRAAHTWLIEQNGEDELNDALNELIIACLSEEVVKRNEEEGQNSIDKVE